MQVTFADKDDTQPLSDPRKIFSDDDCNEMKNAINRNATEKANTSGTNTYTATFTPTITSLSDGLKIHVKIKTASSGPSTLQADATAAKKIFINPTTQADSGDLVDEQEYYMSYDSALDAAAGGWLIIGAGVGGGGTVESVTGDGVDNTDPDNPVIRNASATEKGAVELATPAEAIAGTDTERAVTPEGLQASIDSNSLGFTPADELTEIAGLTLEDNITAADLLAALEIPGSITIYANAGTLLTITNMPSALTALVGSATHYTRINTTNIRRMRLNCMVNTKSASVNNPRLFLQYSINGGSSFVTLGAGTIASGDAISLFTGSVNVQFTNWITVPSEARGDSFIWRIATEGGDGAADPAINALYIEYTT